MTTLPDCRPRSRLGWVLAVMLISAAAVPAKATAAADCEIGCTVVFGLTSFT